MTGNTIVVTFIFELNEAFKKNFNRRMKIIVFLLS